MKKEGGVMLPSFFIHFSRFPGGGQAMRKNADFSRLNVWRLKSGQERRQPVEAGTAGRKAASPAFI